MAGPYELVPQPIGGPMPGPGYPPGYVAPQSGMSPEMVKRMREELLRRLIQGPPSGALGEVDAEMPVQAPAYLDRYPIGPGGMSGVRG